MKRLVVVGAAATLIALGLPGSASAGGGCHGTYVPDAFGSSVTLQDMCFDALVTRVKKGDTIRFTNADEFPHNITGAAFEWGSDGDLRTGETVSFKFGADGVFPYVCTIHPGMVGAVVVGTGIRPPGQPLHISSVTKVQTTSSKPSSPAVSTPPADPPSADASSAAPSSSAAAVLPAGPAAPPPAAGNAKAIDSVPLASRSDGRGDARLAAFALAAALLLAAVALFARRGPRRRELIG